LSYKLHASVEPKFTFTLFRKKFFAFREQKLTKINKITKIFAKIDVKIFCKNENICENFREKQKLIQKFFAKTIIFGKKNYFHRASLQFVWWKVSP
jgi:hypothetical protein